MKLDAQAVTHFGLWMFQIDQASRNDAQN